MPSEPEIRSDRAIPDSTDSSPMGIPLVRILLFLSVAAALIGWVAAGDGEYASAARFFLKQLFRQMF